MDTLTAAAASGLRARQEALDMLANNIANAGTAGFKKDSEFYGLFSDADAVAQWEQAPLIGTMPVVEKPWTDFSQGTLQLTGNTLDLALSGAGFFAVDAGNGRTLYTRNGGFNTTPAGLVTTAEGHAVRLAGGRTLTVRPNVPLDVGRDGTVRQAGTVLGRLEIVDFPKGALVKEGASLFRQVDSKLTPIASTAEVHQGKLETANTNTAEASIRLVSLLRQFEGLQKAITLGGEMNRRAIEDLARVGS
jgi:flagellar basal body rod protein FlgG